eukprot:3506306-Rhodomonas_salina.1
MLELSTAYHAARYSVRRTSRREIADCTPVFLLRRELQHGVEHWYQPLVVLVPPYDSSVPRAR